MLIPKRVDRVECGWGCCNGWAGSRKVDAKLYVEEYATDKTAKEQLGNWVRYDEMKEEKSGKGRRRIESTEIV